MIPDDLLEQFADVIAVKVAAKLAPQRAPAKRLLDAHEAAAYIGRSLASVKHMTIAGALPTVRVGRRVHYDISDLNRWIEENKA